MLPHLIVPESQVFEEAIYCASGNSWGAQVQVREDDANLFIGSSPSQLTISNIIATFAENVRLHTLLGP